eukprot:938329_1
METFVYFIFMVSLWSFGQCGIGNWLCCSNCCCCGYLGRQRDKVHASHTNSSRNTFNNLIFSAEDAASCWNGSRGLSSKSMMITEMKSKTGSAIERELDNDYRTQENELEFIFCVFC